MEEKLSLKRTLLYSTASAGINIMGITVSTWLLYFYAPPPDSGRTAFLPIALVGVLMTVSSLWDAFIDPFIGHWSDTLRSRWGRRRPFLLFAAPVAAISLILIWTPPQGASVTINAIYFFVIVTIFYSATSLVGIPYDASMPEMATDADSLVTLSTWKNVFGIIGVMVGALVAAPLFESIGAVSMGAVVAVVGLIAVWMGAAGLRETKKPVGEPLPVIEGLKTTLKNRQFSYMLLSVLTVHIAYAMIVANLPYFVTLIIGGSEADVGLFTGVLVLTMLISAPFWNWISKKYPNRVLLTATMLGLGITIALNYLVGSLSFASPMTQGMITFGLIGPVLGGYLILSFAVMGSVVDYDELFTHSRREAIYYGTFSLAASIGPSLSALILPFVLENFGYTKANPHGVQIVWLIAAFLSILGAVIFSKFKLGDTIEETRANLGLSQ
jgi:GPH family glycoside/pentoside/hexuronide:cation symporter